jgi:hypothetical protein
VASGSGVTAAAMRPPALPAPPKRSSRRRLPTGPELAERTAPPR